MTTRLLLFANSFPFGAQEPYLMRELEFYDGFDEVYIFALSIKTAQRSVQRPLPLPNAKVIPIDFRSNAFYAANAVRSLPNKAMWAEIGRLRKTGRLAPARLVQVLSQFSRADHETRLISRYIRANIPDRPGDRTTLYAYRFLYQPYLMSKVAGAFSDAVLIGRAHGIDLYEDRSATNYLPGREQNLNVLTELHTVSQHGADYIVGRYPTFADKVRATYLGTEDYGVRPERISDGVLRLVSCSNVVGVKRMELLVDALCQVPRDVPVRWVHYGDGEDLDAIQRRAQRIPGHVEVEFRGRVDNEKILQAYRAGEHDVIINVSRSEGLPVSLMEACSVGVPAIATDVGGTREIVADDVNGVLLPAHPSASEVAAAIARFGRMSDSEYAGMSREARRTWEASFDSVRNYSRFADSMLDRR